MTPPQRRGGQGGTGIGSEGRGAGKGGGRGGGGRGARGGGRGARGGSATTETATASDTQPSPSEGGGGARNAKQKPPRKNRGGDASRSSGGGGAPPARPARVVSMVRRKVLIRNIPHDWDESKLAELVEAHGASREHMWRFVAGKVRSNNRAPRPGRLYLDFKRDAELAKIVIEKLHGFSVSEAKDEVKLDVDFAPFQKIPREKQRKDAKVGTIDRDPDFIAFLEALSKPKEKLPSADVATESKDPDGSADKPVAALVQFLNERKRDKKGKFVGKAAEKRGARGKVAKEGKGTKDKSKSIKSKSKSGEPTVLKESTKARKSRGKVSKDKASELEQVEPGSVRIMGLKNRDSSVAGPDSKATATDASAPEVAGMPSKPKPSAKCGVNKSRSRAPQAGTKEPGSEAAPSEAGTGTKEPAAKGGGRARRDSRAGKGPKGGGRGDQSKKVFAPKVTTPAG